MRFDCFYSRTLLTLALIACFQLPGYALDEADATTGTTLKGGVVKIDVTLNDLEDARLSISRVRKATSNLYDEVSRREMNYVNTPNVVGSIVLSTPTVIAGPVLPARKKWVDASMSEISPIINLFKEDVDQAIESNRRTDVSDKAKKTLDPLREEVFASVKQAFEMYKNLENLTAGPSYDNPAIASAANNMDKHFRGLDKTLKRAIKILQKEARASRKA